MLMRKSQHSILDHVAIIMDGNGRWALKRGMDRIMGHRNGIKAVSNTVEQAAESGIEYLTLFAFSSDYLTI